MARSLRFDRAGLHQKFVHCLGEDPVRSERYLNRLRELTTELETEREALRAREDELAASRSRLAEQAARKEEKRRSRASAALDRALAEFRGLG